MVRNRIFDKEIINKNALIKSAGNCGVQVHRVAAVSPAAFRAVAGRIQKSFLGHFLPFAICLLLNGPEQRIPFFLSGEGFGGWGVGGGGGLTPVPILPMDPIVDCYGLLCTVDPHLHMAGTHFLYEALWSPQQP